MMMVINKLTDFITVSTVDVVDVIAVLARVLGVGVIKGQSVPADLKLGSSFLALVILVTRAFVSKEAVILGAFEALAGH